MKQHYSGLSTRRLAVECQPLMATSSAKVKVKTGTVSTKEWEEEDETTGLANAHLSTSITSGL